MASLKALFGSPPDPNAAVGAGNIVEVVNDQIQVTNRLGAVLCDGSMTLQQPSEDQRQPDRSTGAV